MPMMKHQSLSSFPAKNVCISEKEIFSFDYSFYQNSSTKTQKRLRRSRRHDVAMMISAQE
jgi:hypothetical protein